VILRFSTVSLPEVPKNKGADVDFQAVWAHVQCVLVIRESFTKEYGSRVFHSSPCGPLFLHIEPNQLSLITRTHCIAVFPILADVVEVKTGSRSTAHWSNDFIRLNGWLRTCFAQLIIPLDIDGIGQNWEDSNKQSGPPSQYKGRI